jgi:hypothetical protein
MPRKLAAAALFLWLGAAAHAAGIFPDEIGPFKRQPPKTVSVQDSALYDEYGLEATEAAEYVSPDKRFTATAWRLRDSTGALALFEARRPSGATPASVTKLSVRTSDGEIFIYGNYLFQFTGALPDPADLDALYARLPRLERSPLPALMAFLPQEGLVPNSERYIVGPVSLERFAPGIAPSVAAFHMGAEAQVGKYATDKGLLTLAIFAYPTPGMARERYTEFSKIPGVIAKRVISLVAVTINPPDPDSAERVLARVKYETSMTWNEGVPENPVKSMAKLLVDIFIFTGILIAMALVAGIGFGGVRILTRKLNHGQDPNAMITLHLGGK